MRSLNRNATHSGRGHGLSTGFAPGSALCCSARLRVAVDTNCVTGVAAVGAGAEETCSGAGLLVQSPGRMP